MIQAQPINVLEDFALRVKRVRVYSWAGAIALHSTLLFWQGQSMPLDNTPKKSVEITIGQESEEAPETPVQAQPSNKPRAAGPSAKMKNLLAGFRSWGPWGKATARPSAPSQVKGTLAQRSAQLSDIPTTWKPKSPQRVALVGQGASGMEDEAPGPPEKAAASLSPSPWASQKSEVGGGGSLSGADASEDEQSALTAMSSGAPSTWSGTGAEPDQELRESGGGGEKGEGALYEVRGPMARRRVIRSILPQYPDWALEQGLEVDVTVYFVVLPDGSVKQPVLVRKTSGDPRLDELVVRSLQDWKFNPLKSRKKGEQWGLLTFHFRLRG